MKKRIIAENTQYIAFSQQSILLIGVNFQSLNQQTIHELRCLLFNQCSQLTSCLVTKEFICVQKHDPISVSLI